MLWNAGHLRPHRPRPRVGARTCDPTFHWIAGLQFQRDCAVQPRVARNELPWVRAEEISNPNRVESSAVNRKRQRIGRNPVGVGEFLGR